MDVCRIDPSDTKTLRKILQIHDAIPLDWDKSHSVPDGFLEKKISEIQSATIPHGFWILTNSESTEIKGMIWATIKNHPVNESPYCSVTSLWIHPDQRGDRLLPLLSNAVLNWAKEYQATHFQVSTHASNKRMQEILEKQGFIPEMIQYSYRTS